MLVIPRPTAATRRDAWKDAPNLQLSIVPARDEKMPGEWSAHTSSRRVDDGMVRPGVFVVSRVENTRGKRT